MASAGWQALTVPGAFVIGALAGGAAVVYVTRALLTYLRKERDP